MIICISEQNKESLARALTLQVNCTSPHLFLHLSPILVQEQET